MNKPIEEAWKEGFLDETALVAPQINDLYNRKSQQAIDKFIRMLRGNYIVIMIAAAGILVGALTYGAPYAGIIASAALGIFAAHARHQVLRLERVDRTSDSYRYLKSFNEAIAHYMERNAYVFRLTVPVVLIGLGEIALTSEHGLVARLPVLIPAVIVALFAGPISRFDVNLIYSGIINKLREMQADMEEIGAAEA